MESKEIKYLKNEKNGKLYIQCSLSKISIEMWIPNSMAGKLLVTLIGIDLVEMLRKGVCNSYYTRVRMSTALKKW